MKNGKKLQLKIGVIAVLAVITVGYVFSMNIIDAESVNFTIPTQIATITNPDIKCKISTRLHVIDTLGLTTYVTPYTSYSGNPTLTYSIVDPQTGKALSGFVNQPTGICTSTASISMQPVTTKVTGTVSKNGQIITVYEKSFSGGNLLTFPVGSTTPKDLMSLTTYNGYAKDIEAKLGSSDFLGNVIFSFEGTFNVWFTDYNYPSGIWQLKVPTKTLLVNMPIKIVSPQSVTDPSTKDPDQDGIVDLYDKCPNEKETFNGYQDGDGCPDTLPTVTCPSGTALDSKGNCVSVEPIIECGEGFIYDSNTKSCVDKTVICPDGQIWMSTKCVPSSDASIGDSVKTGKIISNITYKYMDGTTQQLFSDQLSTTKSGGLTLKSVVGLPTMKSPKALASLTVEPYFTVSSLSEAQSLKLISSGVKFQPVIKVAGTEIKLAERQQVGAFATNGNSLFNKYFGFSLGRITLTADEIQTQAIQQKLVTEGQSRDIILDINYNGFFNVQRSGTSGTVLIGDSYIQFTTFQINNQVSSKTQECNQVGYHIEVVLNPDGNTYSQQCVKDGFTATDPNSCTIGEVGCLICTDATSPSGYPCTKSYRDQYCSGTTMCKTTTPKDNPCTSGVCVEEPFACPSGYVLNSSGKCILSEGNTTACPSGQLRNIDGICETPKLSINCPDSYTPSAENDRCVYTGIGGGSNECNDYTSCSPNQGGNQGGNLGGINSGKIGNDVIDFFTGKSSINGIPLVVILILVIVLIIIIAKATNRKPKYSQY